MKSLVASTTVRGSVVARDEFRKIAEQERGAYFTGSFRASERAGERESRKGGEGRVEAGPPIAAPEDSQLL